MYIIRYYLLANWTELKFCNHKISSTLYKYIYIYIYIYKGLNLFYGYRISIIEREREREREREIIIAKYRWSNG